jgi:hypothetical protein
MANEASKKALSFERAWWTTTIICQQNQVHLCSISTKDWARGIRDQQGRQCTLFANHHSWQSLTGNVSWKRPTWTATILWSPSWSNIIWS